MLSSSQTRLLKTTHIVAVIADVLVILQTLRVPCSGWWHVMPEVEKYEHCCSSRTGTVSNGPRPKVKQPMPALKKMCWVPRLREGVP